MENFSFISLVNRKDQPSGQVGKLSYKNGLSDYIISEELLKFAELLNMTTFELPELSM